MFAEQTRTAACMLAGLEHLDDRYLKAVGYATKSKRGGAAEDGAARRHRRRRRRRGGARRLARSCASPTRAAAKASSPSAPRRARSSGSTASAPRRSRKHTNAFKINEDVVIPLPRMGEYTDGIERINIELSLATSWSWSTRSRRSSRAATLPLGKSDDAGEIAVAPSCSKTASQQALALLRERRARCGARWLDRPRRGRRPTEPRAARIFAALQDHTLRASWKTQIRAPLQSIFAGAAFAPILDECQQIHSEVLRGRVWVALHMHAGDGNVHTNIPVNSRRLRDAADGARGGRAHHGAGARARRRDLGRARHRHHQARVPDRRRDSRRSPTTSSGSIPKGRFNKGKLLRQPALHADLTQRLHAELRPDGPRVADHAAVATSARSPTRSRTACAAASASRCARRTCRAPTCSTARATRSSRPRC